MKHPGEREIFRVERHLLYASAALTHWEQPKAAAARKKAAKAKKKPNPKPDAYPPAEPAPKPTKPEPKPEAKQAPQPQPLMRPQSRWMPQRNPRPNLQRNHLPKPMPRPRMGVKPRQRPPFGRTREAPGLRFRAARTSKDKGQRKAMKWTGHIEN